MAQFTVQFMDSQMGNCSLAKFVKVRAYLNAASTDEIIFTEGTTERLILLQTALENLTPWDEFSPRSSITPILFLAEDLQRAWRTSQVYPVNAGV
jgi:hypothetical protein